MLEDICAGPMISAADVAAAEAASEAAAPAPPPIKAKKRKRADPAQTDLI